MSKDFMFPANFIKWDNEKLNMKTSCSKFIPRLKWLLFIYIVTFLIIIPTISSKLPFSKLYHFFNSDSFLSEKANSLNAKRLNDARHYFEMMDKDVSKEFYEREKDEELDLVVVIVTVNRVSADGYDLGYLLQTAAKTDKLIKKDKYFKKKTMFLCNVDRHPDKHLDAKLLMNYLPFVQRYGNNDLSLNTLNDSQQKFYRNSHQSIKYEKETIDYTYCLESANSLNPNFVLLMEDDVLPYDSLFEVLKYSVNTPILHFNAKGQKTQRSFAYIKLYYPQRWQGYANELFRILELLSIACLGSGVFLLFHGLCFYFQRKADNQMLYFLGGAIYFLLFALLIGRQNVMELRRMSKYLYSFHESPGCCTQAMLYPKQVIPDLVRFLSNVQTSEYYHTDIAIYDFLKRSNMSAYQIEPNLFHHVGMYTSLNNKGPKKAEEFIFDVLL